MKKIIVLLVVFFYCLVPQAQERLPGEIFIELVNRPANWSLEVTVSKENTYWDADFNHSYHYLSEDYDGDTETFTSLPNNTLGIGLCYHPSSAPFFIGLGKYKIEFEYDNVTSYFYIDYRTSELPECAFGGPDISFDYNMGLKQFRQNVGGTSINGTTQNFWDHNGYCDQETEDLEPYTPTLTSSPYYDHPNLEWSFEAWDDYRTGNEVWRSFGTWVKLATTQPNDTDWVDWTYTIGDRQVSYKVKAINGDMESGWSNVISYSPSKKIGPDNKSPIVHSYELEQNFPNPFNPTTIITFSIKKESFVNLRIIDILGRDITTLVNENLPEGRHQVEFNGSSIESGIYFYEITANEFRDIKKLILIK
ncbi:MAG: hypothetical protein DRQ13_03060 [Ignavibacteriae bacterium]|nr:MAG: hypothetical protein DRQ13_03060 [Ignavibacteriota bacterium]